MIAMTALRSGRKPSSWLVRSLSGGGKTATSSAAATPGVARMGDDLHGAADDGGQARCPHSVLIVTGVGMRGVLEDDLRKRVEEMFTPAVPVLVHRYGVARSGSLFRPCQRAATRRLASRLRELSGEDGGLEPGPPDVIAHSFGAWLVGHALRQNPDISVGRIIMAGSVLRPDFDWSAIIEGGQAEVILNHYGSRDLWAFASEFFIPDSGPAGLRGFAPCPGVFNPPRAGLPASDVL